MPVDVTATLREALKELEREKTRIEQQIAAIRTVLNGGGARGRQPRAGGRRTRRMSAAARRAASQRMKAYWAKRRAAMANGKGPRKEK